MMDLANTAVLSTQGASEHSETHGVPGFRRDAQGKPVIRNVPDDIYAYGDLIRRTELLLLELFGRGLLSGTTHTCVGQEFCQMATVRALDDPEDFILSNHRNHGHFLAYSGDFMGLVAEIMGRESGVCRGRGGSQHLAYRNFHSNGVQGGLTAIGTGLAMARKLGKSRGIVAAIIGDGTLGQGLVYESLNLSSVWRVPLLFVVENNGIAQTTETRNTIGGSIEGRGAAFGLPVWRFDDAAPDFFACVEEVVRWVRESRCPGFLIIDTQRMGPHSKGDDSRPRATIATIEERDPLRRLGDRLPEPVRTAIDARNCAFLREIAAQAEASPEAKFNERPQNIFFVETGHRYPAKASAGGKVLASLNEAIRGLLAGSDRTLILGEDLHDPYGGAFKVTKGLQTNYPSRVISTPISEAAIVGAGIGLAMAGFRPIVEIMFADFATLAMDQLYNHAVKFPGIFSGMQVPLVVRTPAGGRRGYGPTHSQSPEGLFTSVPGLTVVCGSPRHDAGELLRRATLDWPYPVLFIEHKLLYGATQDPADYETIESKDIATALFPTLVRHRKDADIAIITFGGMTPIVEKVATRLEQEEELTVQIVLPSLLSPLPKRELALVLQDTARVVIAEEGPVQFGVGAEISASLHEAGYRGKIVRIGAPCFPIPSARSLECDILPDEAQITRAILELF
jgi:2-oxoisovalerate dehydrogenase E1 component